MLNDNTQPEFLDWVLETCKIEKKCFHITDGLLWHVKSMFGQKIEQLCVPLNRRLFTLKAAHEMLGGHMADKKTRQRIKLSGLFWPTIKADTKQFCLECHSCQTRARVTCYDRTPIKAMPRADETFSHWFMDA